MNDVAREAGVGVATVDRVINQRARVNPETAQKVLDAAARLGYRRTGLIRQQVERGPARHLGFVLQRRSSAFYRGLGAALVAAAEADPLVRATVEHLDDLSPQHVAERLRQLARQADVLALVAADHPLVNQAIDQLAAQGKPVFALISELSATACAGYVGLDNRRVGRTAAWAMQRLIPRPLSGHSAPAKVALMVGSHRYLCQEQCEMSFRAHLREHAPNLQLLETLVSLEDTRLAQAATLDLLHRHPDLAGLYVAGGGIEGVLMGLQSLQEAQEAGAAGEAGAARPAPRPVTVCHDLTDITREALIDGRVDLVLSHPLDWLACRLVEQMHAALQGRRPPGALGGAQQVLLPFLTQTAAGV